MTLAQPDAGSKVLAIGNDAPPLLAAFPRFGALTMYLAHAQHRPALATLGVSMLTLYLAHVLAAIDANQGPAWLAAITGSVGVSGGLGAIVYHVWREWRQQAREDRRERDAIARIDQRERDFLARVERDWREHRAAVAEDLAAAQARLDAINAEIAEAAQRRHKWANEKNAQLLEMELRLQEQAAEIERLKGGGA